MGYAKMTAYQLSLLIKRFWLLKSSQRTFKYMVFVGIMIPITVSLYVRCHHSDKLRIAVLSNCAIDFWTIAGKGTEAAKRDFDADITFRMPAFASAAEQNRIVEDMVVRGVRGIAISPADAINQTAVFNRIIPDNVFFITQVSVRRAPSSQDVVVK
jgi:ABC-type sugar transport system substrate-binding protein